MGSFGLDNYLTKEEEKNNRNTSPTVFTKVSSPFKSQINKKNRLTMGRSFHTLFLVASTTLFPRVRGRRRRAFDNPKVWDRRPRTEQTKETLHPNGKDRSEGRTQYYSSFTPFLTERIIFYSTERIMFHQTYLIPTSVLPGTRVPDLCRPSVRPSSPQSKDPRTRNDVVSLETEVEGDRDSLLPQKSSYLYQSPSGNLYS